MEHTILSQIKKPNDLNSLNNKELDILACDIRKEIIEVVSKNGGHLASSLGVVELTIALHKVYDLPNDKIVWDVGHQGYVHKLLTGRQDWFKSLRQDDGCSGFLSREESEYDCFGAGHAGTAISAGLGMAAARDRQNKQEKIIAVVGDGSLNCGSSLEGLNNVAETTKDFIVILNDNKMSISENVGAIPRYLNKIISDSWYNKTKNFIKNWLGRIPYGEKLHKIISKIDEGIKNIFIPGAFFEELGFRYFGPIDGHDTNTLLKTFEMIKHCKTPVIVHVITEKGKGYSFAEEKPEKFHGLAPFNPDNGNVDKISLETTYSNAFGEAMCELAKKQENLVAISAAMCSGTGLSEFSKKFPKQFYDVGIAEEHSLIFAAGLATQGIRPIVAMYATFVQRGLDYIFHDICLQNLPVIIALDRAGIVDDGPTHHGIHDISFLRNMPNISILQPKDACELRNMLFKSYEQNSPVIIRYPKGNAESVTYQKEEDLKWGKAEIVREGNDIAIWAIGREIVTAISIAKELEQKGISATVVNTRFLKPFDNDLLMSQSKTMPIISIEDSQISGGLGGIIDEQLINIEHKGVLHFGWSDKIIPHGTVKRLREKFNMSEEYILKIILEYIKNN